MKIISIFLVSFILCSPVINAQAPLMVQGTSPKLHLVHVVVARENWYSIGRLYNLSPKDMALFNNLSMEKPLAIGQQLMIPLTSANFSQDNKKAADEVFVPLYHTIQEKEWMYRISQNYNKVPIEKLQEWNHVTNDQIRPGMNLVVGYLKVKPSQSALAARSGNVDVVAVNKPEVKTEEPQKEVAKIPEKKTEDKPVVKTENKPVENKPVESQPVAIRAVDYKGGFFKTQYDASGRSASGPAGIFRSTSGWQDGKYYALMNNVPVGTIVKVANPSTGKSVYAKVLGNLPDMKESNGLTIRISDAAATELGIAANKFTVDVKY